MLNAPALLRRDELLLRSPLCLFPQASEEQRHLTERLLMDMGPMEPWQLTSAATQSVAQCRKLFASVFVLVSQFAEKVME